MTDEIDDYLLAFSPDAGTESATRTALVILDLQYASASREEGLGARLEKGGRAAAGEYRFRNIEDRVIPTLVDLLPRVRERDLLLVYVGSGSLRGDFTDVAPHLRDFAQWVDNRAGSRSFDFLDEISPEPTDVVLRKNTVSALASTSLLSVLRTNDITSVAVAGVSTNGCVDGTARDAADLGYRTTILADATCAANAKLEAGALRSFGRLFGSVVTAEEWYASLI